jgi:hypothetical protein
MKRKPYSRRKRATTKSVLRLPDLRFRHGPPNQKDTYRIRYIVMVSDRAEISNHRPHFRKRPRHFNLVLFLQGRYSLAPLSWIVSGPIAPQCLGLEAGNDILPR